MLVYFQITQTFAASNDWDLADQILGSLSWHLSYYCLEEKIQFRNLRGLILVLKAILCDEGAFESSLIMNLRGCPS